MNLKGNDMTPEEQIAKAKAHIEAQIVDGSKVMKMDYDSTYGPTCDHCGKTGIKLVLVLIGQAGDDMLDDPMSFVEYTYGTSCFKKLGLKLKTFKH